MPESLDRVESAAALLVDKNLLGIAAAEIKGQGLLGLSVDEIVDRPAVGGLVGVKASLEAGGEAGAAGESLGRPAEMESPVGLKTVAHAVMPTRTSRVDPQDSVVQERVDTTPMDLAEDVIESAPGSAEQQFSMAISPWSTQNDLGNGILDLISVRYTHDKLCA
jgi:hypothetical protein